HRILALARHGQVIGRAGRVRRTVHQEQDRQRRLAGLWRADALAPQVELHAALLGPIVLAPDLGSVARRNGGGGPRLRGSRPQARRQARTQTKSSSHDDLATRKRTIDLVHGVLPRARSAAGPFLNWWGNLAKLGARRQQRVRAWRPCVQTCSRQSETAD